MTYKSRLMVPGPTPLPPEVLAAAAVPIEDERTVEYAAIFTRVLDNLRRVLFTRNDVLLFTSSMTGAFEGAVQNLLAPGERVLVVDNGVFGGRWVELCRSFGLEVVRVAGAWGEPADMAEVARTVDATPGLAAAIAVHCETSTGAVNDIRGFAAAAGGLLTLVDSASGVGACELRADDWGVDVVVGGCQKALMTPPGLAFVSVSERAWQRHREVSAPRYYFDWDAAREAMLAQIPRTPWTPAISLIRQLDAALGRLHAEGAEQVFARHVGLGRAARAGVRGMGLRLFSPDEDRSASVTAAELPAGLDGELVLAHLKERYGVQLADGQGALGGRILRIGHCGYCDVFDVVAALSAIELTLRDLGHPVELGAGVSAALQAAAQAPLRPSAAAGEARLAQPGKGS